MNIFDIYIIVFTLICAFKLIFSTSDTDNNVEESNSINISTSKVDVVVKVTVIHYTANLKDERSETEELKPMRDWRTIPPRILVEDVLHWAKRNIKPEKERRITPKIIFNNSTKGSIFGAYYFQTKTIEIYYRKHTNLNMLIETVLHEYIHHLQLRYLKDDTKYHRLTRKVGYFNNPFEVEARELAKKYRDQCIRDLRIR